MTTRRGRCNNIGLCENAARQRTLAVAEAEPFACPKCGSELISVADRKSTRSAGSMALPLVVIALAVAGAGYEAWDIYGQPHAAPAALAANTQNAPEQPAIAPARPQTDAAPQPALAAAQATPAAAAAEQAAAPTQLAAQPASFTQPAVPESQPAAPATAAAALPKPAAEAAPLASAQPAPAVQMPVPPPPVQVAAVATPLPDATPAAPAPPPEPDAAASADPGERVQAFLGGATRVPITFNFRSSVVAVTGRSEQEVDKLISYLKQHHATGEQVYLAGFTDNQGDPASNEAVSQKRVAAVAAALADAGIKPAHLASFGSATPVADNATQSGRDRNRRVEVYLAP